MAWCRNLHHEEFPRPFTPAPAFHANRSHDSLSNFSQSWRLLPVYGADLSVEFSLSFAGQCLDLIKHPAEVPAAHLPVPMQFRRIRKGFKKGADAGRGNGAVLE